MAEGANAAGPLVASPHNHHRNVIGAHSGSYALYRALAIAAGQLDEEGGPLNIEVVLPLATAVYADRVYLAHKLAKKRAR